jgi:hypothetical protein
MNLRGILANSKRLAHLASGSDSSRCGYIIHTAPWSYKAVAVSPLFWTPILLRQHSGEPEPESCRGR